MKAQNFKADWGVGRGMFYGPESFREFETRGYEIPKNEDCAHVFRDIRRGSARDSSDSELREEAKIK